MDIHRSRYIPFPTSPINSVSFSRTSDKSVGEVKPALKLALGRADGSIEIWNPDRGHWVQESVFPGGEGRSIEGLVWTQDPNDTDVDEKPILGQLRLFSIGSTSAVTEWNLATGRPLRASTGNFSEVWCLAAQPTWKATKATTETPGWKGQDLVAGCGDGTLAILTTADDDLTFKRFLTRSGSQKTRCMSVTWQNRERVIAGFSDSNIRVYDSRNGTVLRAISLGVGIPGAPKDILVWRVKCLPTGDIVSADSNGEVRFWDGRTYSMMQRITGHDSDCLDLVTSSDGQTVFSGGIDGRIATYKLTSRDGEKRRWAKLNHRRIYQGDVKSMAAYDSKQMSVVVSGGADTEPAVLPLREMNKENHRKLPGLPQVQPCASAADARLVASWWEREVHIWRIGKQETMGLTPDARSKQLVFKLVIQGEDNISAVSLSSDGRLLAVSTFAGTRLFQLRPSKQQVDRLRALPIDLPTEVTKEGSRQVMLSPDGLWLATVNLSNEIKVMRITASHGDEDRMSVVKETAELEREFRKTTQQTGLKAYDQTINRLAFSSDSKILCTSDLSGHLDAFILTGVIDPSAPAVERVQPTRNGKQTRATKPTDSDSDSSSDDEDDLPLSFSGQTWSLSPITPKLPRLDSAPLLLSFHPLPPSQHLLLILTQHHQLYEFDLSSGKLTDWSRRNPSGLLPAELRSIKDRATGLIWDPRPGPRASRLWLHGATWLAMLDVSQDLGGEVELKRKRRESEYAARLKRRGVSGAGDPMARGETGGVAIDDSVAVVVDEDMEDAMPLAREDGEKPGSAQGRRWWCTFKYRPILGVVPLATEVGEPLEVVLVERPLWDLEHLQR